MKLNKFLLLITICFLCFQCREVEDPVEFGLEYYPILLGAEWIYQIDSTNYNEFSGAKSESRIFIKNVRTTDLKDASGREIHEVNQFYTHDTLEYWKYFNKFTIYKDEYLVEEERNNVKIVPLVFPIKRNKSWNGNQFNNKGSQPFVYKKVESRYSDTLGTHYNVLMVQQIDDSTFFDQQRDIEYYGKNVGLIYKEHINFVIQDNKKGGSKITWRLLDYKTK